MFDLHDDSDHLSKEERLKAQRRAKHIASCAKSHSKRKSKKKQK